MYIKSTTQAESKSEFLLLINFRMYRQNYQKEPIDSEIVVAQFFSDANIYWEDTVSHLCLLSSNSNQEDMYQSSIQSKLSCPASRFKSRGTYVVDSIGHSAKQSVSKAMDLHIDIDTPRDVYNSHYNKENEYF